VANQDQPDGDAIQSGNVTPAAVTLLPAGMSRRRFAGLGASGVILTLASQPAMANSVMCTSLSAAGSVVHSRSTTVLVCNGLSPGYYHKAANWAGTGIDPNGMFKNYFSTAGLGRLLIPYTMLQIVNGDFAIKSPTGQITTPTTNPDQYNVARHVIATWLNVLSHRVSFFTVESVMSMWSEYAATGHYLPTAGAVPWSGTTLVTHLKERMS
jgi:hypothetical protein